MSTRKIIDPKQNGEKVWLKGHAQATFMSDGSTVEDAINGMTGGSGGTLDISNLATKLELAQKQDIISDIDTIRQGAAKGATALQSYTEQYKGTVTGVKVNGTTKNPSNGVVDLGTVITSHQDISSKQDKLVSGTNIKTINGTSILGSGNITISGGSSSSGNVAYAEVNHGTSDTTFTLTSNTFHVWDEVAELTLTLGEETYGMANEYLFQFASDTTATSLTLPDNIKWANDETPEIEGNYIYQISILKGLATFMKFPNIVKKIINFKIDSKVFEAEEGMTWETWIGSHYNTSEYIKVNNQKVINSYTDKPLLNDFYSTVYSTDIIYASTYTFTNPYA